MNPLSTKRLILREWKETDRQPFADMNSDPSVMEKIGMTRNSADDFEHPKLSIDHFLSKHVLYRIFNNKTVHRHMPDP